MAEGASRSRDALLDETRRGSRASTVLVAIATYTFLRPGKLEALRWEDLDLDHGVIHVQRAVERRTKAIKGTKSKHARRFRIEPALLLLLDVLRQEGEGVGRVVPVPGDLARTFRSCLERAGVSRLELFEATPTRQAITFRDLRATGITWQAVRGDEPLRIMQRAGHSDLETTMIYVRTAEELGDRFGDVFPERPAEPLRKNARTRLAAP